MTLGHFNPVIIDRLSYTSLIVSWTGGIEHVIFKEHQYMPEAMQNLYIIIFLHEHENRWLKHESEIL